LTTELIEKIEIISEQVYEESLHHRRYLHQHPELSWQEKNTSAYIQDFLKKENIPFEIYAKHGIVAIIACKNPSSRCIALRADMDALPIQEENEIVYKSTCEQVMHACGHDVHMACLMGAIQVINILKEEIEGTIKCIFQPSEEKQPSGAQKMIEEGVLNNPKVDEIYGLHVTPELLCGQIGYRAGKFMASADEIYITIEGPGGHAAQAYQTVDTILVASHIIVALQQIVSRNANPLMPTVLSFGDIQGHGATNIIPK
jgi:amidohydrolase